MTVWVLTRAELDRSGFEVVSVYADHALADHDLKLLTEHADSAHWILHPRELRIMDFKPSLDFAPVTGET